MPKVPLSAASIRQSIGRHLAADIALGGALAGFCGREPTGDNGCRPWDYRSVIIVFWEIISIVLEEAVG